MLPKDEVFDVIFQRTTIIWSQPLFSGILKGRIHKLISNFNLVTSNTYNQHSHFEFCFFHPTFPVFKPHCKGSREFKDVLYFVPVSETTLEYFWAKMVSSNFCPFGVQLFLVLSQSLYLSYTSYVYFTLR